MRLSESEIRSIKETTRNVYGENCKIILFGSRVDDAKRGGDIDLYLTGPDPMELSGYKKKIRFLVELKEKIGEQKIDLD